jgi:hypothetical protein
MESSFVIFLLALAFSGNGKDAAFDCYSHVILLHFGQVSFQEILAIILADINLRRPICDCQAAVGLTTAYSVRESADETIEAILRRLFHLSELIPCY